MSVTIREVLGYASDPKFSEQLHNLEHHNQVERIILQREDTLRRRLRISSDQGTECLISIPRSQQLSDGAVLLFEESRAIVVRMSEEEWLTIAPIDVAAAVELGYFAGNLHWRVRFEGSNLKVALEGPETIYLDRLKSFFESGRVTRVQDG